MYFIQVELLAKKYEEKYKQVGEIASKLAIEEAKYRDIQVYTSRYVRKDTESKAFCLSLWYSILDFYSYMFLSFCNLFIGKKDGAA